MGSSAAFRTVIFTIFFGGGFIACTTSREVWTVVGAGAGAGAGTGAGVGAGTVAGTTLLKILERNS
jgi:hypothetical protein